MDGRLNWQTDITEILTWSFVDISCKQPISCLLCIRTSQVKLTKVGHIKHSYSIPTGQTLIPNLGSNKNVKCIYIYCFFLKSKNKQTKKINKCKINKHWNWKQTLSQTSTKVAHHIMMWREGKSVLFAEYLAVFVNSVLGDVVGSIVIII